MSRLYRVDVSADHAYLSVIPTTPRRQSNGAENVRRRCLRWSSPRPQDHSGNGPFYPKAPMGTRVHGAVMPAIEPLALSPRDAAQFLSISKRSLSRLIARKKIAARKDGPRTLVDVASLKAYYANLPLKTDHAPLVFGRRAHMSPFST